MALSIKQPWIEFIISGIKDYENRTWNANYRGPLLLCSSALPDLKWREKLQRKASREANKAYSGRVMATQALNGFPNGKAIGICYLSYIVKDCHPSHWCDDSKFHFRLVAPTRFRKPFKLKGMNKLFKVQTKDLTPEALSHINHYKYKWERRPHRITPGDILEPSKVFDEPKENPNKRTCTTCGGDGEMLGAENILTPCTECDSKGYVIT